LGITNAKIIAQTAKIDGGEVYRQLEILQKKSLVEKILASPNEYKPMALDAALKMLIQQKNRENLEIQQKAKSLLKRGIKVDTIDEEGFKISVIPKRDYLSHYIDEANNRCKKEWLWFTQIERIPIVTTTHSKSFKEALDRGVRWYTIAELNKPTDKIIGFIRKYSKENPNFFTRFVNPTLLVTFAILDSKELDFFTEVAKGASDSQALYTNNPQIVKVIKDYFELRWNTAMTEYPQKED
jgi:sugar-specific transcriptional regulator TrmB